MLQSFGKESVFEIGSPVENDPFYLYSSKHIQEFPYELYFERNYQCCASILEASSIYTEDAINHLIKLGARLVKYEVTKANGLRLFEDVDIPTSFRNKDKEDLTVILFYLKSFYMFDKDRESGLFSVKVFFHPNFNNAPLSFLKDFIKLAEKKSRISILVSDCGEIVAKSVELEDNHEMNLSINYGERFLDIHEKLIDKLNNYNKGGLYMFHGDPGTGKSTYIRHLTSVIDREFIFIPPNSVEMLTSPTLLTTLLQHKNSILVIEDAEKAIQSRDENDNASLVSSILNMSDGLLGSLLQISLIVTYNCERNLIDKALLRKGRLILDHGFKNLSIKDGQNLINMLGYDYQVEKEMSLAELYNLNESNGYVKKEPKRMGFGA